MRKLLPFLALTLVIACSSAPTAQPTVPSPTRAAVFMTAGERLPSGSLVVLQSGQQRALLPDGRSVALVEPQLGGRGSPNGAFGVALAENSGAFDLALVDYRQNPPAVRPIPEGRGLRNPVILWQTDSSGFAFYDLPLSGGLRSQTETLYYYSVSDNQSRALLSAEQTAGKRAAALAFSPNGAYLLYSLLGEDAEAIGAQVGTGYVVNLRAAQPVILPEGALLGFSGWLGDSSGFLSLHNDPQTGRNTLWLYYLARLGEPKRLTAERDNVILAASAPDGKQIALVTRTSEGSSILRVLTLEDGSLRDLHRLEQGQGFSALFWSAPEAIYFSTSSAEGDRTWRIAPSGDGLAEIAEGTLRYIVQ